MAALNTSENAGIDFPIINTDDFSRHLRDRAIDVANQRVLITRFTGSQEERDFSVPSNCQGFGRIHHFRRQQGPSWPENSLPIEPAAKALRISAPETLKVQVFQNAVCNWRCWYCFVDFELLAGDRRFSEFKSCAELLDLYEREADPPHVIDLSGGQPDLVPEWSVWFISELGNRGLGNSIYLWSDDNLSNDYLWRYLTPDQIKTLAQSKQYGRVGCFKGFDQLSFSFNTKAAPELFERQFELMNRIVQGDFDVYGYATFTTTSSDNLRNKMAQFVDRLQEIHHLFPLRTLPLLVSAYSPTQARLDNTKLKALELQLEAVSVWQEELNGRYDQATLQKPITEHRINDH
jgi:uncharacterized Fe-S cluster-containing radical SAM superfamily protein